MSSFTLRSENGPLTEIITEVKILPPTNLKEGMVVKAIWDTSATTSSITTAVVQELGLVSFGTSRVKTANGIALQNKYSLDIGLPSLTLVQNLLVSEIDELGMGCDALIGMDVINLCDFSITNHRGITCMSFRIPSRHEIDYVKNPNFVF
jgi:hypothetical protein